MRLSKEDMREYQRRRRGSTPCPLCGAIRTKKEAEEEVKKIIQKKQTAGAAVHHPVKCPGVLLSCRCTRCSNGG